jgi:2-succinyl-5-enolpyruvyl-6-hydroxy-3-cyclohexene-1-carboxylate synthase
MSGAGYGGGVTPANTFDLVLAAVLHPDDAVMVAPVLIKLGAPIVAEATANLHLFQALHPLLIEGGEKALKMCAATRILRIGAVPSWRFWRDLEDRPEVMVTNFSRAPFRGLAREVNVSTYPLESLLDLPASSTVPWELKGVSPDLDAFPLSEPAWMGHLLRALPAGSRVFLGNSLPIREWNLAMKVPAEGVHFYANRGANGIDGLISTFLGVAASNAGESWLILGDLSALYDLAAPWIIQQLDNPKIRIVIVNNGGGKIFSQVSSLRDLPDKAREVIENRHDMSFEPFAKLWRMDYLQVQNPMDLDGISDGPLIIEIRPDPSQTEAFWAAWQSQ